MNVMREKKRGLEEKKDCPMWSWSRLTRTNPEQRRKNLEAQKKKKAKLESEITTSDENEMKVKTDTRNKEMYLKSINARLVKENKKLSEELDCITSNVRAKSTTVKGKTNSLSTLINDKSRLEQELKLLKDKFAKMELSKKCLKECRIVDGMIKKETRSVIKDTTNQFCKLNKYRIEMEKLESELENTKDLLKKLTTQLPKSQKVVNRLKLKKKAIEAKVKALKLAIEKCTSKSLTKDIEDNRLRIDILKREVS